MILVLVFIIASYFFSLQLKKFKYAGLEFEKTKLGKINFYLAKMPLKDMFGNQASYVSVYFREDPRKLERIKILNNLLLGKNSVFAAESRSLNCEDSNIASGTLFLFLSNIGIRPYIGELDGVEALKNNKPIVDCAGNYSHSQVIFKKGNESIIKKENNCYIIQTANCEIMNVTERFILGVYAHSNNIKI